MERGKILNNSAIKINNFYYDQAIKIAWNNKKGGLIEIDGRKWQGAFNAISRCNRLRKKLRNTSCYITIC